MFSFLLIVICCAYKPQTPPPHIWTTITALEYEIKHTMTITTTTKILFHKVRERPQLWIEASPQHNESDYNQKQKGEKE